MSWWSLFRSTVVPAVQQAISSSTQPTDAPPAAETDDPAAAERRRQALGTVAGGAYAAGVPQDSVFAPSSFAQQFGLTEVERAIAEGRPLPQEIKEQLAAVLPEWGYEGISWEPDSSPPIVYRADWMQRPDQQLYDAVRGNIESRMDDSSPFGGVLEDLVGLDPTGISQLFAGDMTPGGLLGMQFDLGAELTGTRPEELAGVTRAGAMMMNPYVALGGSFAPMYVHGAEIDPEEMLKSQILSRAVGMGLDQIAPALSAAGGSVMDWIRELGLTPEQVEKLRAAADAGMDLDFDPNAIANTDFTGGGTMPAATPDPSFSLESLARAGAQPMFSTPAEFSESGMLSRPAMTRFSTPDSLGTEVSLPTATVPLDWQGFVSSLGAPSMPAATPESDPTFEGQLEQTGEGEFEQPAQEQPAQPTALEKGVRSILNKLVNEYLGGEGDMPGDAPTRDEGETDEQYTEELLTYLGLDAQSMADLGLQPGTPEYMQHILEQADLRIAELTEGLDLNAEDLSAQLRAKTDEELKALQRALFVRGQLESMTSSGTVVDPTTGEDVEVIGNGMLNPGMAGYQAGLGRDIEGITSVDQLQKFLTRGFDPYGMQRSQDARLEAAKRNEQEEEELRRRRRGMLGL